MSLDVTVMNGKYDELLSRAVRILKNNNATIGKGLHEDHFSWSCVFVKEFIENF